MPGRRPVRRSSYLRRLGGGAGVRDHRGTAKSRCHPYSGRLREPRHRGQDNVRQVRPREPRSVPGRLLGFQIATLEIPRDLIGMTGANSTEFDKDNAFPVVDLLPEQKNVTKKGATMRLGAQPIMVTKGTASELYGKELLMERHRHRYEVNPKYIEQLESAGWKFTGRSADGVKMEIGEYQGTTLTLWPASSIRSSSRGRTGPLRSISGWSGPRSSTSTAEAGPEQTPFHFILVFIPVLACGYQDRRTVSMDSLADRIRFG